MAKHLTRLVLKKQIQKFYMDEVVVTIPFCHEAFTSIELNCKRGKDKVTMKSPPGQILDLHNQSMRFKQIYEYESKFFVNKGGKA
jgi:hypothetical protein